MTSIPGLGALIGVPAVLAGALTTLSEVRDRLTTVVRSTAVLPAMGRAIDGMAGDTSALDDIRTAIVKVAEATSRLPQVAKATAVLPGMDRRMEVIESAMPTLVEVQQHLAELPEAIRRMTTTLTDLQESVTQLDRNVAGLQRSIDPLAPSMTRLDSDVLTLHKAIEPLGRLAKRVPGGKRSSGRPVDSRRQARRRAWPLVHAQRRRPAARLPGRDRLQNLRGRSASPGETWT